jgi:hypothetical protein
MMNVRRLVAAPSTDSASLVVRAIFQFVQAPAQAISVRA